MKSWLVACALSVGVFIAPASAQDETQKSADAVAEQESPYVILRENVSIPFANRAIRGFEAGEDRRSVIFRGPGRRHYRAELDSFCARNLRFESRIGMRSGPVDDTLRRGSTLYIDRDRCMILSLDEIADPRAQARAEAAEQN
ncbi:MAG: hypothetical protein AB7J28_13770 [Hyphomonadaceae bacterium]